MADPFPDITRNKTVLAVQACPSCGRNNTVRMNNSHRAYWACRWPTGDDGRSCAAERRYSDKETAEIMHRYRQEQLKMKGPKDAQSDPNDTAKDDTGKQGGVYDFYN